MLGDDYKTYLYTCIHQLSVRIIRSHIMYTYTIYTRGVKKFVRFYHALFFGYFCEYLSCMNILNDDCVHETTLPQPRAYAAGLLNISN